MSRTEIGPIRYNAALAAFEARVDIHRSGRTFRYPCQVAAPLDMPEGDLREALKRQAFSMSDSPDLRAVR